MFNRFLMWLGASHASQKTNAKNTLSQVRAQVDDAAGYSGAGWASISGRAQDYDASKVSELYQDSLDAWRKNPIAWRIIQITSDYVIGDGLLIDSPYQSLQRFIRKFWDHPLNQMNLRLEPMCDELARAGDLFVLLFRNPGDGMSYVRFVTKDRITKIETAQNDWEVELAFYERLDVAGSRKWLGVDNPAAADADAVMLHYSVNRPVGAILGEGDMTTMLPWLQRYSRMLEDRVRLNWAIRAFLWFVTVPAQKVKEKQEQYRMPPEPGSVVVKDDGEKWDVQAPDLHAYDAQHDLRAVRQMIDAGSGFPAHWRGEPLGSNLATAKAMQAPTERHLIKRQQYFVYMLEDILYHAYQRAVAVGAQRQLKETDYGKLFSVITTDISREDEADRSRSAAAFARALEVLAAQYPAPSQTLEFGLFQ
jgi:hypothetical protein